MERDGWKPRQPDTGRSNEVKIITIGTFKPGTEGNSVAPTTTRASESRQPRTPEQAVAPQPRQASKEKHIFVPLADDDDGFIPKLHDLKDAEAPEDWGKYVPEPERVIDNGGKYLGGIPFIR